MTSADVTHFVEQWPFVPLTLIMANGRELHVPHNDFVTTANAVQSIYVMLPTGQLEIVDANLVVSIRTVHPAQLPTF